MGKMARCNIDHPKLKYWKNSYRHQAKSLIKIIHKRKKKRPLESLPSIFLFSSIALNFLIRLKKYYETTIKERNKGFLEVTYFIHCLKEIQMLFHKNRKVYFPEKIHLFGKKNSF